MNASTTTFDVLDSAIAHGPDFTSREMQLDTGRTPKSIEAALRNLENQGLIERVEDHQGLRWNPRLVLYRVTSKGRKLHGVYDADAWGAP